MPRARSMSAVVRPPMPPPTMIAFMALTPTRTQQTALKSHMPLFGRKRLCGLCLELGAGFRLSLNFKVLEILPIAHAVAENLLLAGQILRRTEHVSTIPCRRLHGERRVDQMRTAECHQIGAAGGKGGSGLV